MALPGVRVKVSADTREAEAGLERVERGLRETGDAAVIAGTRTNQFGKQLARQAGGSSAFGRGIQNASYQLGDFAVQVGAGTSASIALGQQLPQLLGGFGILGAVLGAVVAIAVPLSRVFKDLSANGNDFSQVLGTMSPLAGMLADAFERVRDIGIQMAEVIINNLDRIIAVGLTAAALFAGKFVFAFVAARVATFSLSAALVTLRAALIRTGIGAIIVGAGELVYQFSRLVQAAGGFGEAMGLLKDIAVEVFGRIKDSFGLVPLAVRAGAARMAAFFVEQIHNMQFAFVEMTWAVADGMNNLFGTDIQGMTGTFGVELNKIRFELEGIAATAEEGMAVLSDSITAPIESITTMRDLLRSMKDERLDLSSLLTGSSEDEDGGGKKGPDTSDIDRYAEALNMLRETGRNTWSSLGEFMQQFAGKSKAAAIATIAISKGLAIAQTIQNTAVAVMKAMTLDPTGVLAARVKTMGAIQVGLIAATGLAQAASAGGGGGGAGGGGGSIGGSGAGVAVPAESERFATLQITGDDSGIMMAMAEKLIPLFNELSEGGRTVRLG